MTEMMFWLVPLDFLDSRHLQKVDLMVCKLGHSYRYLEVLGNVMTLPSHTLPRKAEAVKYISCPYRTCFTLKKFFFFFF